MTSEEEAQAWVLAAAHVLRDHLPDIRLIPNGWGSAVEGAMRARVRELEDNEPHHLRPDQLLELHCLWLIEAIKLHRLAARLE